jgi:hypothetical protein
MRDGATRQPRLRENPVIILVCRIVIAVCAEIINHFQQETEVEEEYVEVFGPRIQWGGNAPKESVD